MLTTDRGSGIMRAAKLHKIWIPDVKIFSGRSSEKFLRNDGGRVLIYIMLKSDFSSSMSSKSCTSVGFRIFLEAGKKWIQNFTLQ